MPGGHGDGAWLYLVGETSDAPVQQVAATAAGGSTPPHLAPEDEERLRSAIAAWVTAQGQQPEELACPRSGLVLAIEPVAADERLVGLLVAGWQAGRRASPPTTTRALLTLLAAEAVVVLQRLELQAQLLRASRTDALTGLLDRRAFNEALRAALSTAERGDDQVTLVLLDLDHFKAFQRPVRAPGGRRAGAGGDGGLARGGPAAGRPRADRRRRVRAPAAAHGGGARRPGPRTPARGDRRGRRSPPAPRRGGPATTRAG